MEEDTNFRERHRRKVFTIEMGSESVSSSVACHIRSSSEVEEEFSPNQSSSYRDSKRLGLVSVYRSATVPLEVGGLKLMCEDGNRERHTDKDSSDDCKPGVKVAWCIDTPSPTQGSRVRRRSTGSASAGSVNQAKLSAIVRRRQQRRSRRNSVVGRNLDCLRMILSVLYYLGVSPYRPRSAWKLPKFVTQLLKVVYWIIKALAIVESVSYLKLCCVEFGVDPNIQSIAEIGIAVISIATRIYTMKVFAAMGTQIDRLLHQTYEDDVENLDRGMTRNPNSKLAIYIGVCMAMSTAMAMCSVIFGYYPLKTWSFESQQRLVAYGQSKIIAVWMPTNWKNETDKLSNEFLTAPLSTKSVALAIIGDVGLFAGEIYENLTVDFWLALCYQVHLMQLDLMQFTGKIQGSTGSVVFDHKWNLYMECRIECDLIDDIFGNLQKFVHFRNIVRLSEFLLNVMENDLSAQHIAHLMSLFKICVAYYICTLSANTNAKMQEEVVNQADSNGFVEVNGEKLTLYALRMEMDHHPIGLGRGNFFVEETFVIKMVCAAWSVFAMFADHSEGQR